MSLQSQLEAEADKIFDTAYYEMFDGFSRDFHALLGINLRGYGATGVPTSCAVFRDFVRLSMDATPAASEMKTAMRKIYREKYIAAFIEAAEAARRQPAPPPLTPGERFWLRVETLLRRGA